MNSSVSGNNSSNLWSRDLRLNHTMRNGPMPANNPVATANTCATGSSSHPAAKPAPKHTRVRWTNRAGCHCMPACSRNWASLGPSLYLSTSICAKRFLGDPTCRTTELSAAAPLAFFFFLPTPVRRALILSTSEDLTYFDTISHAPMNTAQIMMSVRTKFISNLHHLVEQIGAQPDPRAQQLFVEFRPDTCGGEPAYHLAIRVETPFFEHEQILQRDHFSFHACHFRDRDHPARAVAHT